MESQNFTEEKIQVAQRVLGRLDEYDDWVVENELKASGLFSDEEAETMVAHFKKKLDWQKRKAGFTRMGIGGVILIAGLAFTSATGGNTVFYGAILVGLVQLVRGVMILSN